MTNHLAGETSPYLLQHDSNPVDWYPWGDEALNRARAEDKPILLSIGYSACHWCHVMAHESFENEEIARLMNDNFINIKVDREERPDLDSIYMEAVQALTGRGGWPLTVFLTPGGEPFYGGTYFPPADRYGVPGFPQILLSVVDAYRNRRDQIEHVTGQIVTSLASQTMSSAIGEPLKEDSFKEAHLYLSQNFDEQNGGFGSMPKFPHPLTLEFLLRYYHHNHDETTLKMVNLTLEKMARGGMYDHIGGGFHRYSTDAYWLVPHFEKMLYDNALLSQLYLHAYLATGRQLYRIVAEGTFDYVLREMTGVQGGFYSTQDADSEGMEGKYYVWTAKEIADVLGEKDAQTINEYFGVTNEGNFEGRNILHIAGESTPALSSIIKQARASLLERREGRVKPGRDEKVLASWNGLMLASMAEAACALDREDYLAAAVDNGSFLLKSMTVDGHLKHVYKDGEAKINGYLQDYALVIDGLLTLHQATFSGEWLRQAIKLADIMIEQFWDISEKMFYDTSERHEELFVRPRDTFDGVLPSGSSAATMALLKLAALTGNEQYKEIAIQSLQLMQKYMAQSPLGFSNWLCAADFYLSTPKEIAIIGPRDNSATSELLRTLCTTWLPNKVVAAYDPDDPNPVSGLKLFEDRPMIKNKPTVYVCEQCVCKLPVTDSASLAAQLQ